MFSKIKLFFKDESGQAMTEYGLIIALVAVAVIVTISAMGGQLSTLFETITAKLKPAAG
ncbi:MAG TPA: Flp family type IVb pilin [Desulfosporosinus sp.]|nr:Flp family type IVb pilin [Desulfosporosinus sp.]